jgi:hypothetical protein
MRREICGGEGGQFSILFEPRETMTSTLKVQQARSRGAFGIADLHTNVRPVRMVQEGNSS